jgi:hypothetical protein
MWVRVNQLRLAKEPITFLFSFALKLPSVAAGISCGDETGSMLWVGQGGIRFHRKEEFYGARHALVD